MMIPTASGCSEPELASEPLNGVVGSAEPMVVHEILPNRRGLATSTDPDFDRFAEWLANTLRLPRRR
jgi:hypothetical protein